MILMLWRAAAKKAQKRLLACINHQELWARLDELSSETPIYIDMNLGGTKSGEQLARELAEAGYRNLFYQTGYAGHLSSASIPSWIKGVLAKDPPWQ